MENFLQMQEESIRNGTVKDIKWIEHDPCYVFHEEGFCIALIKQDEKAYSDGLPSLHEVGTYVEIVDFNQLQNGLLGITVKGLNKVKILDRWKQDDELLLANISKLKEFEEDFSEDPSYKEIWSMLIEISNHPEVKKLNLELSLQTHQHYLICLIKCFNKRYRITKISG